MNKKIIINPIGVLHSKLKERYETPRQGVFAADIQAEIHLIPHMNFEQALKDIEGIERLWIIYWFHKNTNWKPMVNPPRYPSRKVGVFATRSPFRPNQIGLSCVKLLKVEGLKIFVSECDILDGSPVLDIKPYLPYSDSFPDSSTGWVITDTKQMFTVSFENEAMKYALDLKQYKNVNLLDYARIQLEFNPTDTSRKRISTIDQLNYFLDYQQWQIHYRINEEMKEVIIIHIKDRKDNSNL